MSVQSPSLESLFNQAWAAAGARSDKLTGDHIDLPPTAMWGEAVPVEPTGHDLPVLQHLDDALMVSQDYGLAHLAASFAGCLDRLAWSQNRAYVEMGGQDEFLNGYAFATLSGPQGPIKRAVPLGGFILLAPNLHYPGHYHPPREIYLILTPGARWKIEGGDWFDVSPGDLILHQPSVVHATMTSDEPFLAFVSWLDASSREDISWA